MDDFNSEITPYAYSEKPPMGEDILSTFFTSTPVMMGIAEVEDHHDIRHILDNSATEEFFGTPPSALQGKLASELGVPDEMIDLWIEQYEKAHVSGHPVVFDYVHQTATDTFYLNVTVSFMGLAPSGYPRFSYVAHDITKIKKRKMDLEIEVDKRTKEFNLSTLKLESELAQLEAILQSVSDGVAVFNMQGELIMLNNAAGRMSGYTDASAMKNHLEEFKQKYEVYDLNGKKLDSDTEWPLVRLLKGESIRDLELYTIKKGEEKKKLISYSAQPVFDKAGHQVLGILILRDITAERETAAEYEINSNILTTIMNTSEDVIYVKDRQSRMIYSNPAALKLIGKPAENVLGKNDMEFLDSELGKPILENDKLVMETGQSHIFEEKVGRNVYMSSKHPYRDLSGQVIGLIGISRDITERKAEEDKLKELNEKLNMSRKKFATVVNSAPFAVAILDLKEKKIVDVNPAWIKMYGFNKEEAINKTGHDLGINFVDDFRDEAYRILESEGSLKGYEATFYTQRRHPMRISCNLDIIELEGEKYILACMEDITDRWKATIELEEALQARDEFLSIASHELKTPLSSLTLQAQLFLRKVHKGDPDAFRKENVLKIVGQTEKQLKRLSRLVDDMLDISRIRTGRLSISKEEFNLCDLIENVIEQLRPYIKSADTEIKVISCESHHGHWDLFRMEQVLTNLITNAIRYGNKKPIEVKLEEKEHKVLISVKDQGLGISDADKERIFRRFERAISKNEVPGLGLGLYISEQIIRAHEGRIWVESELGKGSTFFIELPLQ